MNKVELHEAVYQFLMECRQKEQEAGRSFTFTFRKYNRKSRLDDGLWFYGDDWYMAVSFWTGMDWKNKTPNFIFVHDGNNSNYLEISTTDSQKKTRFVKEVMVEPLELSEWGYKYLKTYTEKDPIRALQHFLETDKVAIDKLLERAVSYGVGPTDDEGLGFIDEQEFDKRHQKILRFRRALQQKRHAGLPNSLRSFSVSGLGPIHELHLDNIGDDAQWIFITGENGMGKTSVLRALAIGLLQNHDNGEEMAASNGLEKTFRIDLTIQNRGVPHEHHIEFETYHQKSPPLPKGFVAYGPSRLTTEAYFPLEMDIELQEKTIEEFDLLPNRRNTFKMATSGLFHPLGVLRDLEVAFEQWTKKDPMAAEERLQSLCEAIIEIMPNLGKISTVRSELELGIRYHELDDEGIALDEGVAFYQLASGTRSMVLLISDLLVRLSEQQPNVDDMSEYEGIVIIDEIDVHLHPAYQKKMVEQLSATFPKIQFIATTHSPISLLGAPKGSVFYLTKRSRDKGVYVERLDIDLKNLTPNLLLTSPLFGFNEIFSYQLTDDEGNLITDDFWGIHKAKKASIEALVQKHKKRKESREND